MGKKIREFMTHREPPEHIWMEREESAVIGTARMGQRMIPKIRPFDLLRSTPLSGNRARATVFEGDVCDATEYIQAEANSPRGGSRFSLFAVFRTLDDRQRVRQRGSRAGGNRADSRGDLSSDDRLGRMSQSARGDAGVRDRRRGPGEADDAAKFYRACFGADCRFEWTQSGSGRRGPGARAYQLLGPAIGSLGRARRRSAHRLQAGRRQGCKKTERLQLFHRHDR